MARPLSRRPQNGYLLEIPILVMVVGVVVAILFPNLPPWGQKILIAIAAFPILFGLFYMIVIPGWMPGNERRLKPPWRLLGFLLLALPIIGGVVMYILA